LPMADNSAVVIVVLAWIVNLHMTASGNGSEW
jgi:hypothetical protein